MTSPNSSDSILKFLSDIPELKVIDTQTLNELKDSIEVVEYSMGQAILRRERMPTEVLFVMEGRARLLGATPKSDSLTSIKFLEPGAIVGWLSLVRNLSCEDVIASEKTTCLYLSSEKFWQADPKFQAAFRDRVGEIEVFDLLVAVDLNNSADFLAQLTKDLFGECRVTTLEYGKISILNLDQDFLWLVSGGESNFKIGSRFKLKQSEYNAQIKEIGIAQGSFLRLIGIPITEVVGAMPHLNADDIPQPPDSPEMDNSPDPKGTDYPHFSEHKSLGASFACFQMLAEYLKIRFPRDKVERALLKTTKLSLRQCREIAELIGLHGELCEIPIDRIAQVSTPAMLAWDDTFAVLYEVSDRKLVLGIPKQGIVPIKKADFANTCGDSVELLSVQSTKNTTKQKFGLSWFLPSLKKYKISLITVLVASFFVQLLGLANPLITQVIIDKVIIQNAPGTLNTLGILLVGVLLFEAIISYLRTYLLVNTTSRIDYKLGSDTINHLVRLPLPYFEKRSVGDLFTRIGELEKIRQFLTETALLAVLDAVFSVIYIIIMIYYSWSLTLVALGTVPLFALIIFCFAPQIYDQLNTTAECNAATQSYLNEVVSGIQTVKAQSLEKESRRKWQGRYAKYISEGFKTVIISTKVGSTGKFLNQLSNLLLLWVGSYLVLTNKLSLGQLIAFRIIAGYTTTPLIRLIELWQNFQKIALSLERLGDIINSPQEQEEADGDNILMPEIKGKVCYEKVSFRFATLGAWQLENVSLTVPAGKFVGVVGASGAGKSILTKLLFRLYEPNSGRILIDDDYDIRKVELCSLREQIGVVLQDTLLFDGSVRDNIMINSPEATQEEMIKAAKIACAHEFIMKLPDGYMSRVGEKGALLSGGQRQRIAIARTVLQNPNLLILDEATSALDYKTESKVCSNLAKEFKDRTVFFVTHRLSTIQNADLILVMDSGRVAEEGKHEELMKKEGIYYALYSQPEAAGGS